jgi:hypothetical protein
MATSNTEYLTVGRGRLYFDMLDPVTGLKTGERYFGNTPKVDFAIANTMLEHYDSDEGLKLKDASIILESEITVTFDTDAIDADNLAVWFLGARENETVVAATGLTETIEMIGNRFYQLGVSPTNPAGLRNLATITLTVPSGTPAIVLNTDYAVDALNGRVQTLPGSTVFTSTPIAVHLTYHQLAGTRTQVIGQGAQIYGALRYVSQQGYGPDRYFYCPYSQISSDGTYSLKGDTWQTMSFKVEVLLPQDGSPRIISDIVGVP